MSEIDLYPVSRMLGRSNQTTAFLDAVRRIVEDEKNFSNARLAQQKMILKEVKDISEKIQYVSKALSPHSKLFDLQDRTKPFLDTCVSMWDSRNSSNVSAELLVESLDSLSSFLGEHVAQPLGCTKPDRDNLIVRISKAYGYFFERLPLTTEYSTDLEVIFYIVEQAGHDTKGLNKSLVVRLLKTIRSDYEVARKLHFWPWIAELEFYSPSK